MLIKPESFAGEIGQRLGRQADSWRFEMVAEQIEPAFPPAHGGLVRVLGQLQALEGLVQRPDRFPQLPPGGGQAHAGSAADDDDALSFKVIIAS
ncbi:MAG: hypothetical protein ABSA04_02675 [Desulfobaccales bacterium]